MFIALDQYVFIVDIFNNEVMLMLSINLHQNCFNRRVALHQHT